VKCDRRSSGVSVVAALHHPHNVRIKPFEVPVFHRALSEWLNNLIRAGFVLERISEPMADEATASRVPAVAGTRRVAYFLHVRCRELSR